MDFSFTKEQLELKASAIEFAKRELNEGLQNREEKEEFPREAWMACAKFGVQGLPIPEELGGGGLDIISTVLVMEGLGYGCRDNGLIFSLNAQMWSLEIPLLEFGTDVQKSNYLPGMASGLENVEVTRTTNLIDTSVLDSLSILKLVLFLEERFSVKIDPLEVIKENFETVLAIGRFMRAKGIASGKA